VSRFDRMLRGKPPATGEDADQITVQKLAGMGADLSLPRQIVHFLELSSGHAVEDARAALERAGYEVTVEEPDEETTHYLVRAEAVRVVSYSTVPAFRTWFERLAAEHGGEYEGWEAARTP
jgi:regulator of ribonuclease activity B